MRDLLVNLLASVVAGAAAWLAQRALSYRRLARKRAFFGLGEGATCLLAVARHASSPHQLSVHRRDVAALVELAAIARECGAQADLRPENDVPQGIGRLTEFCVGGPPMNARTGAHLRWILRGVRVQPYDPEVRELRFSVGTTTFRHEPGKAAYVVLARAWGPSGGQPVFVIGGQTASSNLAAARFLTANYRQLHRQYGATKQFCLVLRIVEPAVYGSEFTEIVADMTSQAFHPPEPSPRVATS
jgi:hypothetical protein